MDDARPTGMPWPLLAAVAVMLAGAAAAQTIPAPPPTGTLVPERIEPHPAEPTAPPRAGDGPSPRSLRPPAPDPGIVAPTPTPDPSPTPLVPPQPPGQPRPDAPRP
jgi:hypothetical protein